MSVGAVSHEYADFFVGAAALRVRRQFPGDAIAPQPAGTEAIFEQAAPKAVSLQNGLNLLLVFLLLVSLGLLVKSWCARACTHFMPPLELSPVRAAGINRHLRLPPLARSSQRPQRRDHSRLPYLHRCAPSCSGWPSQWNQCAHATSPIAEGSVP
eukprot:SAG11_NODE_624_length_8113_cov_9.987397_4_plen_155_part_00